MSALKSSVLIAFVFFVCSLPAWGMDEDNEKKTIPAKFLFDTLHTYTVEEIQSIFSPILKGTAKEKFKDYVTALFQSGSPKHQGEELVQCWACSYEGLFGKNEDTQLKEINNLFGFSPHKAGINKQNPDLAKSLTRPAWEQDD